MKDPRDSTQSRDGEEHGPLDQIPHVDWIGGYRILGSIGHGGFGIVYLAEDLKLERKLAIKVLAPHLSSHPACKERFDREARSAASLRHPNIITVHSSGDQAGTSYLVMDYVQGDTLRELSRQGLLSQDRILQAVMEIADGLDYAHRHGIIHRDLKPANIMIDSESGRSVIMDFGLARPERPGGTITPEEDMLGSPPYMSPEQIDDSLGPVDRRTDIYSLGVLLYELITEKEAFYGKSNAIVMRKVLDEKFVPPSKHKPNMSKDLEAIILKAMAKDHKKRYQSALEMKEDIQRFLNGITVKARRRTALTIGLKWFQRNRAIVQVAVVCLVLGMLPGFFMYRAWKNKAGPRVIRVSSASREPMWSAWEDEAFEGDSLDPEAWLPQGDPDMFLVLQGALRFQGENPAVVWYRDPLLGDFQFNLTVVPQDMEDSSTERSLGILLKDLVTDRYFRIHLSGLKGKVKKDEALVVSPAVYLCGNDPFKTQDLERIVQGTPFLWHDAPFQVSLIRENEFLRVFVEKHPVLEVYGILENQVQLGLLASPADETTPLFRGLSAERVTFLGKGDLLLNVPGKYLAQGDFQTAEKGFKDLLKYNVKLTSRQRARAFAGLALSVGRQGRISECKDFFKQAMEAAGPGSLDITTRVELIQLLVEEEEDVDVDPKEFFELDEVQNASLLFLRMGDLDMSRRLYVDLADQRALGHLRDPSLCFSLGEAWKRGGGGPRQALFNLLEDKDPVKREYAIWAIGQAEMKDAVPQLMNMLKDPDPACQKAAAVALGKVGSVDSVPQLLGMLDDEMAECRQSAMIALARLDAEDHVLHELDDKKGQSAIHAMEALSHFGGKESVSKIAEFLDHPDGKLRAWAARSLGEMKATEKIPKIRELLEDEDPHCRRFAAWALGQLGARSCIPRLEVMLKDEHASCRAYAAGALGQLGSTKSVDKLLAQLQDEDPQARGRAALALGMLGETSALRRILDMLHDDNPLSRAHAAEALGLLRDSSAIEPLLEVVKKDQHSSCVIMATLSLGKLYASSAVPFLLPLLDRPESDVRWAAATTLGRLRAKEASVPLCGLLQDEEPDCRQAAAKALGRMGSELAVPGLLALLEDRHCQCRDAAAEALGKLKHPDAFPGLVHILADPCGHCRKKAIVALGELGLKQAIPVLKTALEDSYCHCQEQAARALGKLQAIQAAPEIMELLDHRCQHCRIPAIEILGKMGHQDAAVKLADLLKDENSAVRSAAARALEKLSESWQAPLEQDLSEDPGPSSLMDSLLVELRKELGHEDPQIRALAALALGTLRDTESLAALRECLVDHDCRVQDAAALALGQMTDSESGYDLLFLLAHRCSHCRARAAHALGKVGYTEAIPRLLLLLRDKSQTCRFEAAQALGSLGASEAEKALRDMLGDEDAHIRASACLALGELGVLDAAQEIFPLLWDRHWACRANAAKALGQLTFRQAVPRLMVLLEDKDEDCRANAAKALADLGVHESIPPITELLEDPHPKCRVSASESLAALGVNIPR